LSFSRKIAIFTFSEFTKITDRYSTEKTVLPKYLKICLDIDMQIITLDHQNNNIKRSNMVIILQKVLTF